VVTVQGGGGGGFAEFGGELPVESSTCRWFSEGSCICKGKSPSKCPVSQPKVNEV
jgi:hypothetical protein